MNASPEYITERNRIVRALKLNAHSAVDSLAAEITDLKKQVAEKEHQIRIHNGRFQPDYIKKIEAGERQWLFKNRDEASFFASRLCRIVKKYFSEKYHAVRQNHEVFLFEGIRPAFKYADIIERAKSENYVKYSDYNWTSAESVRATIKKHLQRSGSDIQVSL